MKGWVRCFREGKYGFIEKDMAVNDDFVSLKVKTLVPTVIVDNR